MSTTTTSDISLKVTRYIKAPCKRIFEAWTTPEDAMRWMGPGACRLLSAKIDARKGGGFYFKMRTDRVGDADIKGTYREFTPFSKLVFTWEWLNNAEMNHGETLVTVEIEEAQGGSNVTLTHEGFQSEESRDGHTHGWNGTLDRLERRMEIAQQMCTPGFFSWNELLVPDVDGAMSFYTKLFGWETTPVQDMPYTLFKKANNEVGGLMKTPVDGMPAHWLAYVTVEDVDASYASAMSLGSVSCAAPFDIPNIGRIAVLLDPQGAKFGIFQPRK